MLGLCKRSIIRSGRDLERSISNSVVQVETLSRCEIKNEPVLGYMKGSKERTELEKEICEMSAKTEEVPIVIGSEEIKDEPRFQVMPHDKAKKIAQFYHGSEKTINKAIEVSVETQKKWDRTPLKDRVAIWEKAADLMAGPYRQRLNAATILGQSKTIIQAEIDAAAELIDFMRFNVHFLRENSAYQPISDNPNTTKNFMRFRGLDGFIAAISPFNFTAIGGNLAYTPALMGNSVLWKPSDTAVLSNWVIFNIMREAGVPPGVVNFIPADGPTFGKTITKSPHLAGINFTGSVPTFNWIWEAVGKNLNHYKNYPRLIGECGGKNYHFVHPSADVQSVVNGTIRSAFEYCGQKCSACSRMYLPSSISQCVLDGLREAWCGLKVGNPADHTMFMGAVIDDKAYNRIKSYIEHAKSCDKCQIIAGGNYEDCLGYFVEPTIIVTKDPLDKLMTEEIFGPVLTIYVYEDKDLDAAMKLVDSSTRFALTGAVFAQDEAFLKRALDEFKMTAGNFYINDKSTGSVVGQQPFGGGRMSGTNDKAGGPTYVMRWTSPQAIKETYEPLCEIEYPYMKEC